MAKVAKAVRVVGQANDDGASFLPGHIMEQVRRAYLAAQELANRESGLTTGPARVLVVVEQDYLE